LVYLGHEMAWDAFTARNRALFAAIAPDATPPRPVDRAWQAIV